MFCFFHFTSPLIINPVSEIDKVINRMKLKYRTYTVEYDSEDVGCLSIYVPFMSVMLNICTYRPLFVIVGCCDVAQHVWSRFWRQDSSFRQPYGPKEQSVWSLCWENQWFVFFLQRMEGAERFLRIGLGAWITLVFVGPGQFAINILDRFGKNVRCPLFEPPMKFTIDKTSVQPTLMLYLPWPLLLLIATLRTTCKLILWKNWLKMMFTKGFWYEYFYLNCFSIRILVC